MASESLLAAIERHETLAETFAGGEDDRADALDRYLGKPLGNEIDGRSQVVSRDVFDTVEWIKPQIAEVFCGGDQVVSFSPRGPEDVKAAEQESEYINHVITERNNWFEIFTNWQHDALLQRNGYVIAYFDESEDRTEEEYENLSPEELALLANDPEVEIVSGEHGPEGYEIKVARTKRYGCVRIENIPPERVLVSHNSRGLNLQDARLDFVEYVEKKTISQLRDEGFDVPDDISDQTNATDQLEEERRNEYRAFRDDGQESSPAAKLLRVRNVWIRFDSDDDGRTELRRVVVVGSTILRDDECDEVTLYALCPMPLPHQHNGQSLADAVIDLEKIKTALLRGALDNVYLANNGRHAIDANRVNLDDMLVSRPGGVVRVQGSLADAIMPLQHTTTGQVAVPMLEYVDRIAQKRTGVSESMQGLNPNALNNSMGAATNMAMVTAAQQRLKFIARTFAETGVKALFRGVHALTLKHARKPEIVRLRNQWVPVDPRQWRKRADMSISVGLGSGDRPAQVAMLTQILQIQAQAAAFGLATPVNVYNTLKRLVSAAGYKDPLEFWTDPSTSPPRPQQPPIELQKAQLEGQMRAQAEMAKVQADIQIKREEFALKMREIDAQLALQQSNDMRDAQRERLKAEFEAALEQQRLQLEGWKAELQAQMDKYQTDANNATKLQLAGMTEQAQREGQLMQIGHEAMQASMAREPGEKPNGKSEAKKPEDGAALFAKAIEGLSHAVGGALRAKRVLVRDPVTGKPSHSVLEPDGE